MVDQTTHSRLIKFDQEFKKVDLAKYYQLKQCPDEFTQIQSSLHANTVLLVIRYQRSVTPHNIGLPPELIRHIYGYLVYQIEIHTKIEYSLYYPFAPPIWYIESVYHTLPHTGYDKFYLFDYYIDKIHQHNHLYNRLLLEGTQWNPAISVEKDILLFVKRVYHFDEIMNMMGL
jgi:hypothetical protein